jgi:hypothetical protein
MYTTALEYHIGVLQGLQKVSAYTDDMFNPEEIDLHLTKQQSRLVEEIVNKRFEDLQTGLDYIQPLIVKNKSLQVFLPDVAALSYEPSMVYSVLPPNYLNLITDRSQVVTSNSVLYCSDISAFKTNVSFQSIYTEYISAVPMVISTATIAPFYYNFTMTITKSGNPISVSVPTTWNISSINSNFQVINYVMENFSFDGVSIYWENYRGVHYANSFVLVTTDATITNVTLNTTKSAVDISNGGSSTATFTGTAYKVPNYAAIPGYLVNYAGNTLTENDDIYTQNNNVFYRSKVQAPKSLIATDNLLAYESKNFLISKMVIDYVRIPRQISLSLNQISELGGNAPSIIVDRTVEYLKLAIENPSYQAVLNDNKLRNQI